MLAVQDPCRAIYSNSGVQKVLEGVICRYDNRGLPVFKNLYFANLGNDELSIPGLFCLAFLGADLQKLPLDIRAFLNAYASNSLGKDKSPLGSYQTLAFAEYARKKERFLELRQLLSGSFIEQIKGGWIGLQVLEPERSDAINTSAASGNSVKAARITRNEGTITTEIASFPAESWGQYSLDIIRLSYEYRQTMIWLLQHGLL